MSTFHSASGFVYQRPEKYEYTYFRQKVGTTKVTGMAEFIGHISLPNEVMPPRVAELHDRLSRYSACQQDNSQMH